LDEIVFRGGSQIEIKTVEPNQRGQVYQFRYQIYFQEFGDERFADHKTREYRDSDDVPESSVFAALSCGQIVGTLRVKPLVRRDFLNLEQFDLDELAREIKATPEKIRSQIVCFDRGLVAKDYHKQGVMTAMLAEGERVALQLGFSILLLAVAVANQSAKRTFNKFGFREFRSSGNHQGLECSHTYKLIGEMNSNSSDQGSDN